MTTDVPAEALWRPLTDIENWGKLDVQIESIEIDGAAEIGKLFFLKPKSGPRLKLQVTELNEPAVYADRCFMPLAKMDTVHRLNRHAHGTEIVTEITISGMLCFFWSRMIGQKHARGIEAMNHRLIAFAKSSSAG